MKQNFDLEAVYTDEIMPVIQRLIALCQKHEIPLVLSATYRLEVVPCDCGEPDCSGEGMNCGVASVVIGKSSRMCGDTQAMAAFTQLPDEIQQQLGRLIFIWN